jgi:phospholipid/cholesterol/gamma-HCH transport system substrate-binding protein
MKDSAVETAIGAIVIVIAAAFLFFIYSTTDKGAASGGRRVVAVFDNIGAVNVGTDVRMAGIKIGSVVAQELDPETYQARVTMAVDSNLKLSDDTSAKISSEGLLGAPFIALDPGGSDTLIDDGGEIQITQGAVDFWKLISESMFSKYDAGQAASPSPDASAPQASPGGELPEAPGALPANEQQ